MPYDVMGLGAPVMDRILKVDDDYLQTLPGELGGMELVDFATFEKILKGSGKVAVPVPGGSASNVMLGLANFGNSCGFIGKVGSDAAGRLYAEAILEMGVGPHLSKSKTPTSQALSLISGDGRRTMRTYIGASNELLASDIQPKWFDGLRLLHLEGYNLFNPEPARRAIELAKDVGAKISLDLGSFEVVRAFRDDIEQLLQKDADIVFANEDEARELTGEDASAACKQLGAWCEVACVMVGANGSFSTDGGEVIHCPVNTIENPTDPTGAGDLFASGFLHGYLKGLTLIECMQLGSMAGAAVVQVLGASIPHGLWSSLLKSKLVG